MQTKRYEIQTYCICGGWVNTSEDQDTYVSHKEAQDELNDLLENLADSVALGFMDDYDPTDWRVAERVERVSRG